jgi:RimJ/RimL family protein N-acetyltransferase
MISIRPCRLDDAPALHEAAASSVAEAYPFMPWCHPGLTLEEMRTWVEAQVQSFAAHKTFEFVILSDGRLVLGVCGLSQLDDANRRANLGYWVRSSAAGRGAATAAVRQLVRWAFENTELIRLEVLVSTRNAPSLRVAEKCGAAREGILRKRLLLHGVSHDAVLFAFVR